MPEPESRPRRAPDVVARNVAGETIIVPIKSSPGEMNDIFTLNQVASRTWELMDGERTITDIAAVIENEFDVSPRQVLRDTLDLIADFTRAQVASCAPDGADGKPDTEAS